MSAFASRATLTDYTTTRLVCDKRFPVNSPLNALRLPTTTRRPLFAGWLLPACCLLLALSGPAWTDEPDAPDELQSAGEEPAGESPRPRDNSAFEVFVPTEQISEDTPVPFPVDI